jgi:uncharacterized HAD superfamily protein
MKLNICVDIDGTITEPYYWLDMANRHFGTDIKPYQVTTYDIHEVLRVSREAYNEFYNLYAEILHSKAEVRENAEIVLWKLNQQHNVFYVTAREQWIRKTTVNWFVKNELPLAELHMLGSHYKVERAKQLECDIFIEDRYENAIQLALEGFQVLLVDCSYNRLPLLPGITRVRDWIDIYEEIETIYEKLNKAEARIA